MFFFWETDANSSLKIADKTEEVANGVSSTKMSVNQELAALVQRLENVAIRLENAPGSGDTNQVVAGKKISPTVTLHVQPPFVQFLCYVFFFSGGIFHRIGVYCQADNHVVGVDFRLGQSHWKTWKFGR